VVTGDVVVDLRSPATVVLVDEGIRMRPWMKLPSYGESCTVQDLLKIWCFLGWQNITWMNYTMAKKLLSIAYPREVDLGVWDGNMALVSPDLWDLEVFIADQLGIWSDLREC